MQLYYYVITSVMLVHVITLIIDAITRNINVITLHTNVDDEQLFFCKTQTHEHVKTYIEIACGLEDVGDNRCQDACCTYVQGLT